ncbi:hypothetical protein OXPF_03520 [Oxobacter pfennigii]|uniref:Universal stress protein family protein n=1 Tax=Oxobacter pfennigii TaxID=36849 RepID=A0A0P9AKL2_9CLOT|nr:universal stress protein UspA [Oxobacter pfennigii]KPU45884.1 hypothetical protein OXPF_03520 [Oxobacter pfennigii]
MGSVKKVLVCVTVQKTCERLIRKGANIRDEIEGELLVIHVAASGANFLGNISEADALEYLFSISKSAGADLTVLRSDDVIKTIIQFAKENKITNVVLGEPPDGRSNTIVNELKRKLEFADIYIMPAKDTID